MKKLFIISAVALGLCSCDDFLTKEPVLASTPEKELSNFEGVDGATYGAFAYLTTGAWYGTTLPLTFDIMCGNGTCGPINTGRNRTEWQWNFAPNATLGTWAAGYSAIAAANAVLNVIIPEIGTDILPNEHRSKLGNTSSSVKYDIFTDESDNVETAAAADKMKVRQQNLANLAAECLWLRALAYFDMVRIYAQPYGYAKTNPELEALGLPLVYNGDITYPHRSSISAVYDRIIADLEAAEVMMSDSYQRAGVKDQKTTVTKPVIQALMARVFLYHEDYQKAADYATKVISNRKYTLANATAYANMWSGSTDVSAATGNEIIFEVYFSQADGSSTNVALPLIAPVSSADKGYGDVRVSNDLLSLFTSPNDVRLSLMSTTNAGYDSQYKWFSKYPGKSTSGRRDILYNNIPVLRLSEMYLIRSEAQARGNFSYEGTTAWTDLNRIATTRGASAYPETGSLLDAIFEENRKEFFLEGHIFFDFARFERSIYREDYDASNNKNILFGQGDDQYKWAFPIMLSEMDVNKNLEQNPGYSSK